MRKVGAFLFRGQPIHNGHLFMIKKALKENDMVVIVLGSANKQGMTRNPFSIQKRKTWLIDSISQDSEISLQDTTRLYIIDLPDWSTETDKNGLKQWGHYLYYNIVRVAGQKDISIYYNDDKSIMESWFDDEIKKNITIEHIERSSLFDGLSATKIRQAMIDENHEYLEKFLPMAVLNDLEDARRILLNIQENPQEDFSMR